MKVKTAISRLEKMNPEAELKLHHPCGEPLLFVMGYANDDSVVWLETESDNDMANEIEARFENAAEEQIDELDFYMDMLETGIDVDIVSKNTDDERADHMEQFCREHGLIQKKQKHLLLAGVFLIHFLFFHISNETIVENMEEE